MMFTLHTVDGCEILHHQFWMVETLEIVGCLPPMKNHRPQLVQNFATMNTIHHGGNSSTVRLAAWKELKKIYRVFDDLAVGGQ